MTNLGRMGRVSTSLTWGRLTASLTTRYACGTECRLGEIGDSVRMNEMVITMPGESGEHRFHLPETSLGEVLSPIPVSPHGELSHLVQRALYYPIGCSPLSDKAGPGSKVLVIVDDITRGTPTARIIPLLLEYLARIGCEERNIRFAIALGTHRAMTDEEVTQKLGPGISTRFEVINTPVQQKQAFVPTGESFQGVPIEVHHCVLEADVVVGIGSVVPHPDVGWSGGAKIIMPGMCSERTVMENHILAASFSQNMLGKSSTTVRQNMEGIVERIGLDFILNVVMMPNGEVVEVSGGHFVAAQRAAVEVAQEIFGVPFRDRADIVVANAYPGEIDLNQGAKAIWAGELMVKPGGVVILNAPCYEGVGPHPDLLDLMVRKPDDIVDGIRRGLVEDKNTAAGALLIARMLEHMRLAIVTSGLPIERVRGGPILFFSSLQNAVDRFLSDSTPECRVSVITHGAYTYPIQRQG